MKSVSAHDDYWGRTPWPTKDHFYTLALQVSLHAHPESSVRLILNHIQADFNFQIDHFYFCLTGLKKNIYNGIFHLSPNEYMDIFIPLKEKISAILFAHNWIGDVFLAWKFDEKQIAVIMSPKADARCTGEELADIIDRLVQQTYEQEIFKGDNRYRNATALCGPLSGFSSICAGYHQARALNDLSFFYMDGRMFTENMIAQSRSDTDYSMILDACFELRGYVDEGNLSKSRQLLHQLFLSTIRDSYSLTLCDDALSFIKSMLQVRCLVYGIQSKESLDLLCSRIRYHKIEECVDALLPVIDTLCGVIHTQGAFSKPVLSAIYYIKLHFASYLVLSDVARYANTNASYLSSKFKKETGCSVRNYINRVRLEAAQQLLLSQSCTVSEIARQVAFEDVRYFTRIFKQFVGCTPTEYRLKNKQGLEEESN